jgi:integrase
MAKQIRKSLPIVQWPAGIQERFLNVFSDKEATHLACLRQMMGRWLLDAEQDGVPPNLVTPSLITRRSEGLIPAHRSKMKQALFEVFEVPCTFVSPDKQIQSSEKEKLSGLVQRHLQRFPTDWHDRAVPMLYVCPEGLADGAIIDARAFSSIKSTMELAGQYFDFCRANDLPVDLDRIPFRAWVAHRRKRFAIGDFSIYTMVIEAGRLLTLGRDVYPERDWEWLSKFLAKMKSLAKYHPTRANGRHVNIEELHIAALQGMEAALEAHEFSSGYRGKLQAHTLARTMLSILMLINSPIRISSLAALDIEQHFDPEMTRLHLSPLETKDRNRDERAIPERLRAVILTYIRHHRSLVAPEDETRLFIGWKGAPCTAGHLSESIGDITETLFGSRVSAHMIRNVIAAFIVSESPAERGLASEVLNHRRNSTTDTYSANSNGIVASRQLSAAADAEKIRLGIGPKIKQKKSKRSRPSGRRKHRGTET